MPKIPWTPPKRPPRIRREEPIADFAPVSENRCEKCVGLGELFRQDPGGPTPIVCWVCDGTGKVLPPPPDAAADLFDPPPWSG